MAWSKDWTPYFDRSEQDKYIYLRNDLKEEIKS
jgi:hypothetical protein